MKPAKIGDTKEEMKMVHSRKFPARICNAARAAQTPEDIEAIRQFCRDQIRAHGLKPIGED